MPNQRGDFPPSLQNNRTPDRTNEVSLMASVIELPCPNCDTVLKVPETAFGKKVKCKHCGEIIAVNESTLPSRKKSPAKSVTVSKPQAPAKKPQAAAPPPPPPPPPPTPANPGYKKFLDDDSEEDTAKPTPLGVIDEGQDIPRCPFCAKELEPPTAIVCIHCGFNNLTRTRADSKKVWAPDLSDWIHHLGPGILALLLAIGLIVLNVICFLNMRDWMTDTFLQKDEKGADGEIAFYIKPGAFITFILAATILPLLKAAQFGIKRCFINYRPEEKVKV
jgi:DNA-directed RNA polymerase subunit M/transcription elongation factor TFIIS